MYVCGVGKEKAKFKSEGGFSAMPMSTEPVADSVRQVIVAHGDNHTTDGGLESLV